MTRRRTSIAGTPRLIGSVSLLITIVAVLLAYNANKGLPFVPTYDVRVELPGGSNLVVGNEVRMGGFRVGIVEDIRPRLAGPGARARGQDVDQRAIAVADLELDKKVEPLPVDTRVEVRPRSALGLKYIALTPGRSSRGYPEGSTIPLSQSTKPTEFDDLFGIQTDEFRSDQRTVLEGYGTALAGRGVAINEVIRDLNPFLRHLEPVMRTLSARDTDLGGFVRQARRTAGQIAPVARTYAALFGNMATTFEALSRHGDRLRAAIERLRPTLDTAIDSFRVQRPFLRDTAELSRYLRPLAIEMERSLPLAADALEVGAPVQAKAPTLYRNTREVFRSLRELAENPSTLLALSDLHRALEVATPLVEFIAPFQTVCSYFNYQLEGLANLQGAQVTGGTALRALLRTSNMTQDNRVNASDSDRPADVPEGHDPRTAKDPTGAELHAAHIPGYGSAIDAEGNADCEAGQRGYIAGPSVPDGRYPPSPDPAQGGGSHVVRALPDVLNGPTFKAIELGIDNLADVP